jgi:hypothetical protein
MERLCRVWSEKQQRYLAVKVRYTFQELGDCGLYAMQEIDCWESHN